MNTRWPSANCAGRATGDFARRLRVSIDAAPRAELEQAALRVTIGSLVLIYLLFYSFRDGVLDPGELEVDTVALAYVLFGALIISRILSTGRNSVVRRLLGIVADNAVTSYCLIQTGEAGAVVLGVYLFVAFGNGFRYGRRYLHASQLLGVIGFGTVLIISPFWSQHFGIASGLLIAMVVLPFYVGVLAERIEHARQRADEANQAKGRFLANVSHEMRTPLNGVIAMADVLRGTPLNDAQREIVDTLGTSANLLLVQIEDVLDMAKIEAGRVQIERSVFDLRQLLTGVTKVVSVQAAGKGIACELSIDPEVGRTYSGDAHHLRQVLLNLVANAVKFTHEGGVHVLARPGVDGQLRFEVRDTGIGIAADKLQAIFEPFTQADDSITRLYGGTGLGTTIARQLTVLMGGTIGVESTPGVGSLFWVEVPLTPCAEPAVPAVEHGSAHGVPARTGTPPAPSGAHILVAEDNATNQRVVELILEAGGHRATIVGSGEQALDELEKGGYDIALFDLSMPVVSGLEALRMYRYTAAAPIPILILSAHVTTEVIADCLAAGAAEFVAKPIRSAPLLEAIARHVKLEAPDLAAPKPRRSERPPTLSVIEAPAIDEAVLADLRRLSSDPSFVARLVDSFKTDLDRLVAEITAALASHNVRAIKDAAHALKGGAGSLGANDLVALSARLENASDEMLERRGAQWTEELRRAADKAVRILDQHATDVRQNVGS